MTYYINYSTWNTYIFGPSCSSQTISVVGTYPIVIEAIAGEGLISPAQADVSSYFTNSDTTKCPITQYSVVDEFGEELLVTQA